MKMKKYDKKTFTDGFLIYGKSERQRSELGKDQGNKFTQIGKLAFNELSHRESDYQVIDVIGGSLDKKVETMYPSSLRKESKKDLMVILDDVKYDVIYVDADSRKRYLYFYLQKAGKTNERTS